MIVAALITLGVVAVLLIVHLRRRGKRDSQKEAADPSNRNTFDTTLGDSHDLRQAVRTAAAHASCFPKSSPQPAIGLIWCLGREPSDVR